MPPTAIHFNGGVNLPDTAGVLNELAKRVPDGVSRLPDGETGERAGWIACQFPRLLATPGLELIDPAADPIALFAAGLPALRLADGADADALPWPDLGYATAYRDSYAVFTGLRDAGTVPSGVRFQVEYPTPFAVCAFVDRDDAPAVERSYGGALHADLAALLADVPHEDVAVQWDIAVEIVFAELAGGAGADAIGVTLAGHLAAVPDDVPVGLHLCYGDLGHRHMVEPSSLAFQVALANAVAANLTRTLDWVSFTVPQDRADDAYFAPLAGLVVDEGTELYFALVPYHPAQQAPGTTDAQAALVDRHLPSAHPSWGICTECSMARVRPDEVSPLLDLHREILERFAGA